MPSIEVKDFATGALKDFARDIASPAVKKVIGAALAQNVIAHFKTLPANKLGGRRHFWEEAAKSTSFEVLPDGGAVNIAKVGVRQRLEGGTIKPVTSKLLTIPARPEAYGVRARDMVGLEFLWGLRGGQPKPIALVTGEGAGRATSSGKRTKKFKSGLLMFWLVESVNQQGDRNTIPSDAELNNTAFTAASAYIEVLKRRASREQGK